MIEPTQWHDLGYEPKEDCPACKGAGFVHPVDNGKPIYSRVTYCTATGCLLESFQANRRKTDALSQTFETFKHVGGTKDAIKYAKQIASGESKFIFLLLYGTTGCGKSHLCEAILKTVKERGVQARMLLSAEIFATLREAIPTDQTETELRRFKDIPFLIIDDYGVEYGSEWEAAKFDELMTSRFATGKHTVVTTNKEFSQLTERIRSRFGDNELARAIYNAAPDYRGKK